MAKTIVIGAGLGGLAAAIRLAQGGQKVTLLTKGLGGLALSQGTVDVLGYIPERVARPTAPTEAGPANGAYAPERVTRPCEAAVALIQADPNHPYAAIGLDSVKAGLTWLRDLLPDFLVGDPEHNIVLPTAVGALRPTCLYQPSMAAGDLSQGRSIALVGPRQLKDFYPELCAANLSRQTAPGGAAIRAAAYRIDLPARPGEADSSALAYARSLDRPDYRQQFADAVRQVIGDEDVVGLPALLGLQDRTTWQAVQDLIGRPVFEIPLPPPAVPGLRLNEALTELAKSAGVRFVIGSKVIGAVTAGDRITAVTLHQAGRDQAWDCDDVVYAPGGFESGALALDSYGHLSETLFNLPLRGADQGVDALITGDYWHDQALFAVGVGVDSAMRVVDAAGQPVFANLHAVGSILAGATRWSEKSGEGIALGSALAATAAILGRR